MREKQKKIEILNRTTQQTLADVYPAMCGRFRSIRARNTCMRKSCHNSHVPYAVAAWIHWIRAETAKHTYSFYHFWIVGNRCGAFTRLSYAVECSKRSRNIGYGECNATRACVLSCWVHSEQMKIKLFSFIKKPRDSCRMALPPIRMDANVQPSNEEDFFTRQTPSPHSHKRSLGRTSSISNAWRVLTNSISSRCVRNIDCIAVLLLTHDFFLSALQSIDFCRLLAMRCECRSVGVCIHRCVFFAMEKNASSRLDNRHLPSTNASSSTSSSQHPYRDEQHSDRPQPEPFFKCILFLYLCVSILYQRSNRMSPIDK